MKKSELRQLIREELRSLISEGPPSMEGSPRSIVKKVEKELGTKLNMIPLAVDGKPKIKITAKISAKKVSDAIEKYIEPAGKRYVSWIIHGTDKSVELT